jgi:NADH-quinone oxidoreductase subunit M
MTTSLLSWIIFTPALMALILMFLPSQLEKNFRLWALLSSFISLILAAKLWLNFDSSYAQFQFAQLIAWIPQLGLSYSVGVDGISLPLVMLTAIISPIALLGTWPSHGLPKKEKFFVSMILFLQTGMYGTFLATDLFLFYFFWEIVLIPMFFMIGIWGGQDRIYATVKFFIFTMVGSLLMLVAIFYLVRSSAIQGGVPTALMSNFNYSQFPLDQSTFSQALKSPQMLLFLAFALAFVIKVPMVPFHTWLPDAHVQAPTIGSVFLAAVLLKMGTYGLMRIAIPFFPQAAVMMAPFFYFLGVVGIIYGALCAMAQTDFKKLVAYSSISHMGYIIVGLFSFDRIATSGALYQMINHGVSAAGLFMIVGFLYERLHTRNLEDFGSLAKVTPMMAIAFLVVTLSSVALPGTNGFVGEFTILLGTFQVAPMVAALSGVGVVLGAVYSLRAYQMVMLGPLTKHENKNIHDLSCREILAMVAIAVLVFGIGFFPQCFFGKSQVTLDFYMTNLLSHIGR